MCKSLRVLTLITTLILLCSMLAACADAGGADDVTTASAGTETAAETAETEAETTSRLDYDDGLAAADFAGADFRVYAQTRFKQYSFAEDYTGEAINDAVYERNHTVSERFNVDLVFKFGAEEAMCTDFMTTVLAGSDDYDLFMGHQLYAGKIFTSGVYADWVPTGIDFTKPWFPSFVSDAVEINGRIYLTISDICLSTAARSTCIFYNMSLAQQYNIPDLYEIVKSGEWTIDKLTEISKNVYSDLDGDGKRSAADQYGAICEMSNSYVAGYIYSLQMDNMIIGDNGTISNNLGSEKNLNAIEKLCALFFDTDGGYMQEAFAANVARFSDGKALFQHGVLEWGVTYYRSDCTFDYGILPYPKYVATQANYYSFPGGATSIIGMPVTAKNYDLIKTMVTALSAETWKKVLPTYTEMTLKSKMARNEQSSEMIGLVLDGRVFDFAGMYDGFNGFSYKLYTAMTNRGNLASYIKSTGKVYTTYYQKIGNMFYK